jgi:hypothetical protein
MPRLPTALKEICKSKPEFAAGAIEFNRTLDPTLFFINEFTGKVSNR